MPIRSRTLPALAALTLQNSEAENTARTANQFLHWLYVVAAVLAVVLFLVILLAVFAWRKNRHANLSGNPDR